MDGKYRFRLIVRSPTQRNLGSLLSPMPALGDLLLVGNTANTHCFRLSITVCLVDTSGS
jgi:hypothetical protein